jgi:hypothetical protein
MGTVPHLSSVPRSGLYKIHFRNHLPTMAYQTRVGQASLAISTPGRRAHHGPGTDRAPPGLWNERREHILGVGGIPSPFVISPWGDRIGEIFIQGPSSYNRAFGSIGGVSNGRGIRLCAAPSSWRIGRFPRPFGAGVQRGTNFSLAGC